MARATAARTMRGRRVRRRSPRRAGSDLGGHGGLGARPSACSPVMRASTARRSISTVGPTHRLGAGQLLDELRQLPSGLVEPLQRRLLGLDRPRSARASSVRRHLLGVVQGVLAGALEHPPGPVLGVGHQRLGLFLGGGQHPAGRSRRCSASASASAQQLVGGASAWPERLRLVAMARSRMASASCVDARPPAEAGGQVGAQDARVDLGCGVGVVSAGRGPRRRRAEDGRPVALQRQAEGRGHLVEERRAPDRGRSRGGSMAKPCVRSRRASAATRS